MRLDNRHQSSWKKRGPGISGKRINLSTVILVCWLLILGGANSPGVQAQVLPMRLKDMVERASTIVTGRIVEVREDSHPDYRNVSVTYVTVEVEEMLKGAPNHRSRHVFMQFGGMGVTRVSELPVYRVGEEVVLFLYPESEYGFTSPVGGGQGKFYLQLDPQTGERVVTKTLNNARLFAGIDTDKLSLAERNAVRDAGQAVGYTTFASLVRKLTKQ